MFLILLHSCLHSCKFCCIRLALHKFVAINQLNLSYLFAVKFDSNSRFQRKSLYYVGIKFKLLA